MVVLQSAVCQRPTNLPDEAVVNFLRDNRDLQLYSRQLLSVLSVHVPHHYQIF